MLICLDNWGLEVGGGHCWPVLTEPREMLLSQPLRRKEAFSTSVLRWLSELFWSGAPWWIWKAQKCSQRLLPSISLIHLESSLCITSFIHQRDFWPYHQNIPNRFIPLDFHHCHTYQSHQHLLPKCYDRPLPRFHISTLAPMVCSQPNSQSDLVKNKVTSSHSSAQNSSMVSLLSPSINKILPCHFVS